MNPEETELERSRVYEIGVQIIPTLGDEGATNRYNELKARVVELGGEILQEGAPERIDLAYPMHQIRDNKKVFYNEAYFAWYKFELDATLIKTLEQELAKNLTIVRSLVFKTVRQNTYIPRKTPRRRSHARSDEGEAADLPPVIADEPVVEEEAEIEAPSILDKKLDELTINDVE